MKKALKFFDAHTHLQKTLELGKFPTMSHIHQRTIEVSSKYNASHVGTINSAAEVRYFRSCKEFLNYPHIYGTFGINPHNAKYYTDEVEDFLIEMMNHPKVIGWGECGLDYAKQLSPIDTQVDIFHRQLYLASEYSKPIVIHSRNALTDTWELMKEVCPREQRFHIICFGYHRKEDFRTINQMFDYFENLFIGVNGSMTTIGKGDGLKEIIQMIPLERILLESNSPFMAPFPFREEEEAHPGMVPIIGQYLANLKGIPYEIVMDVTFKNCLKCYFNKAF